MQFEWDDAKNKINIQKHGIDFQDRINQLLRDYIENDLVE
jgi:uncharacterized DUF497 family protein